MWKWMCSWKRSSTCTCVQGCRLRAPRRTASCSRLQIPASVRGDGFVAGDKVPVEDRIGYVTVELGIWNCAFLKTDVGGDVESV